jgi:hypothetical protein
VSTTPIAIERDSSLKGRPHRIRPRRGHGLLPRVKFAAGERNSWIQVPSIGPSRRAGGCPVDRSKSSRSDAGCPVLCRTPNTRTPPTLIPAKGGGRMNAECRMANDEFDIRHLTFDIRHSTFDIRHFLPSPTLARDCGERHRSTHHSVKDGAPGPAFPSPLRGEKDQRARVHGFRSSARGGLATPVATILRPCRG